MVTADPTFRAFMAVCAFAGLRLGEATGLHVTDVEFLRRSAKIARQIQDGGAEVRLPKYGSERTVKLADPVLDLLAEHISGQRSGRVESPWLFVWWEGKPLHQNTVGYAWRTTCAAAAVEGIRLLDLRHFYASGLIAADCDVVTGAAGSGAREETTTLNTYSHLWPSAEDRTRTAAAQIFAEAIPADTLRTKEATNGSD